jgi:cyclo(L-tyrosyl-L-tyrosyl) synthase
MKKFKFEHLCFGISPYNSLFSVDYISKLICYAQENSKHFHLFLPDTVTIHTLQALGYSEAQANRKLKKQMNWLRNKIVKSLDSFALRTQDYLLDGRTLESIPTFQKELNHVYELYDTQQGFREECLKASHWVLQNKLEQVSEEALQHAVKYFLYEIPLFAATNHIVSTKSSVFCYHQKTRFHDLLYNKQLAYLPKDGQSYAFPDELSSLAY